MAYVSGNLNMVVDTLESTITSWWYSTTDSLATVLAAGYISDASRKGLVKGDLVSVFNMATPSAVFLQVASIVAGAANLQSVSLPAAQFTSIATGNGTLAAGAMEGSAFVTLATSGATALTTRTAAQLIAGIPGGQVGSTYVLRVYNTNAGTLTLTGGTGVTITGTATIATAIFRDYQVTVTGAAAVTMQNLGSGVAN